jgi:hypothetical protein
LAASVPNAPLLPTFNNFNAATLFVNVNPSPDTGGSEIQYYELWVDAGDDFSSSFTQLVNYDGSSATYGATFATDAIV